MPLPFTLPSVACSPLVSTTELVLEAVGRPKGTPRRRRQAVRQRLDRADLAALGPVFGDSCSGFVPDSLFPQPDAFAMSFGDELEALAATPTDQLLEDLEADGLLDSSCWSTAVQAPRRWLDAYLVAIRHAWLEVEPWWNQATPLREREAERVGYALVRGTLDQLLGHLHPNSRLDHDRWYPMPGRPPAVPSMELVLMPMITGPEALLLFGPRPEGADGSEMAVSAIGYPIPGMARMLDHGTTGTPPSSLVALLGAPRAEILRLLDKPLAAGQLARHIHLQPSGVTHHLDVLERSGLIYRERDAQHVMVHRSGRGTALLHLYEP